MEPELAVGSISWLLGVALKLLIYGILLVSIIIHELAHAVSAYYCGDPTAKESKRITFNPLRHLDLIGTFALPIFLDAVNFGVILGYAKPVPVCHYNFRRPKFDMVLVALAGPLSNILMAAGWAVVLLLSMEWEFPLIGVLQYACFTGVIINLFLTLINLLPLPPLDGSHVLLWPVPFHIRERYTKYLLPFSPGSRTKSDHSASGEDKVAMVEE